MRQSLFYIYFLKLNLISDIVFYKAEFFKKMATRGKIKGVIAAEISKELVVRNLPLLRATFAQICSGDGLHQ